MSAVDWFGLIAPYAIFFVLLVVYYFWEGKREQRIRERYDEEADHAR
ncbi:hypothetical protein [Halorussus lipolyticus]|nr:hypothetical protein [Halorussus sp. DT80]